MFKKLSFQNLIILGATVFLAILIGISALFINIPARAATVDNTTDKFITVTGNGIINITPDMAIISLGVITDENDSQTALANNNKLITAVVDSVKSFGVKSNEIQTANFNIYPRYKYDNYGNERTFLGYTVNNTINVTVRNLDNFGKILDSAIKAGANNSTNIQFDYSKRSETYLNALKLATENAKKEAGAIASALGDPELTVVEVSEGTYTNTYYSSSSYNPSTADGGGVPVENGELKVSASVTIKYSFK